MGPHEPRRCRDASGASSGASPAAARGAEAWKASAGEQHPLGADQLRPGPWPVRSHGRLCRPCTYVLAAPLGRALRVPGQRPGTLRGSHCARLHEGQAGPRPEAWAQLGPACRPPPNGRLGHCPAGHLGAGQCPARQWLGRPLAAWRWPLIAHSSGHSGPRPGWPLGVIWSRRAMPAAKIILFFLFFFPASIRPRMLAVAAAKHVPLRAAKQAALAVARAACLAAGRSTQLAAARAVSQQCPGQNIFL